MDIKAPALKEGEKCFDPKNEAEPQEFPANWQSFIDGFSA